VLPGNKKVEAAYYAFLDDYDGRKDIETVVDVCARCGATIVKASNRQKYCAKCSKAEYNKKKAALMRERRASKRA